MTVGNLAALRQRRMVRLLAWSSIAQAGYILAPLGGLASAHGGERSGLAAATVAYTIFFVLIELGAFGALVALRGVADGGEIADYRGAGRRAPWLAALLALAFAGLAGLPPGLAGMFAKVAVVRSLLDGGSAWLAVIVALNAVVGLAYYVRVATALFSAAEEPAGPARPSPGWAVGLSLGFTTAAAVVVGFAPQVVLDVAAYVHP
jgi:NADH-quinone oxidoreductase subunit N